LYTIQWINPVDDLVEKHIDLSNLTYRSLGIVAHHIVDKINENEINDQKVILYTKEQLKKILNLAISQNRLNPDKLKEFVRKKLLG
jgi:hypothetical protein